MKQQHMLFVGMILIVGVFFFLGTYFYQIFPSGLTVKSITTSDVISPNSDLDKIWFLVDTVVGGGQKIVGTITQDEFEQLSGYETEYPLEIEVTASDEKARYNIIDDNDVIYRYSVYDTCVFCECPWGEPYKTWVYYNVIPINRVCVYKVAEGKKGHLDYTSTPFTADIKLTVRGQEITKTISSQETSVDFFYNNELMATAQWVGSLVTGDQPPNPDNFVAVYNYNKQKWDISKETYFSSYKSEMSTLESNLYFCEQSPYTASCSKEATEELVDKSNTYSYHLLYESDLNDFASNVDINQDSSYLDVNLNTRITVPEILFKVKASWLGVAINSGMPKILSANCPTFVSGSDGKIYVSVKNIGAYPGTFIAEVDCDKISPKYSSTYVGNLESGEIKDFTIPIILQEQASDGSEYCTVRVYDYNYPEGDDEISVRCSWTAPEVLTCNFNGVCESDLGENQLNCEDCGELPPLPPGEPESPTTEPKMPLNLLFSAISGGFIFLYLSSPYFKEKDWGKISAFALLGFGIGLLVWLFLSNLGKILLWLGIASIFGGVAIYFFGGVLVVISGFIAMMVKQWRR